jgi:hypothetical protein
MQRRATFGDVHGLPAKHRVHLLGESSLVGEPPQKLQGVVRHSMLRIVEIDARRLRREPLAPGGVGLEEIPEVQGLDLRVVPLKPAP